MASGTPFQTNVIAVPFTTAPLSGEEGCGGGNTLKRADGAEPAEVMSLEIDRYCKVHPAIVVEGAMRRYASLGNATPLRTPEHLHTASTAAFRTS